MTRANYETLELQVLGYFIGCMEEAMQAFQEGRAPQWKKL